MRALALSLLLIVPLHAQDKQKELTARPRSNLDVIVIGDDIVVRTFPKKKLTSITIPKGTTVEALSFSSHEKYVAAYFKGGEVVVWKTDDGKPWQKGSKFKEHWRVQADANLEAIFFDREILEVFGKDQIGQWSMETKAQLPRVRK